MIRLNSGTNFGRYKLGDIEIIALSDGYVDMPTSRLQQDQKPLAKLPKQIELINDKLRLSVNAFLIIDNGEYILIDTGTSNSWEPSMGKLFTALEEAGVSRDSITTIAMTHTHQDHVNGLVDYYGEDAFPNFKKTLCS